MRAVLFWDITQCMVVIPYRCAGQPIGPSFRGQEIQAERKKERFDVHETLHR
jgi:hypothetical protein